MCVAWHLNIPITQIFDLLKHDGSEIVRDAPEPYNHRGFHYQEMCDFCLFHKRGLIDIHLEPMFEDYVLPWDKASRFRFYTKHFDTLLGVGKHMLACNTRVIYDPGRGTQEQYKPEDWIDKVNTLLILL